MRRYTTHLISLAAAALVTLSATSLAKSSRNASTEIDQPPERGTGSAEIHKSYFNAILRKGSPGYDWVRGMINNQPMAENVTLNVRYPADKNFDGLQSPETLILSARAADEHSTYSKNYIIPDGPVPESPGFPGSTPTTNLYCAGVRIGHNMETANIEYTWEWRNTRDSDGDGEMDSDPDWVLTGYAVDILASTEVTLCP